MKQLTKILSLLLLFTFVLGVTSAEAQRTRKKKKDSTEDYFDESGGFKHRLWYGGGVNLGFNSFNGFGTMQIGVSPMVGYKINDILSFGPRVGIDYYEIFTEGSNPRYLFWSFGPFARGKFSETFFAHVEYEVRGVSTLNNAAGTSEGLGDDNFYLGLGYQSSGGGLFGYEILGLYNFLEENQGRVPITLRVGFNYNF